MTTRGGNALCNSRAAAVRDDPHSEQHMERAAARTSRRPLRFLSRPLLFASAEFRRLRMRGFRTHRFSASSPFGIMRISPEGYPMICGILAPGDGTMACQGFIPLAPMLQDPRTESQGDCAGSFPRPNPTSAEFPASRWPHRQSACGWAWLECRPQWCRAARPLVTTARLPIMAPSPMVTPARTTTS